jgi:hypothetical protein
MSSIFVTSETALEREGCTQAGTGLASTKAGKGAILPEECPPGITLSAYGTVHSQVQHDVQFHPEKHQAGTAPQPRGTVLCN